MEAEANSYSDAVIGSDRSGTAGDIIIADNVTITATVNSGGSAAAIGSGVAGHIGNIKIGGNR
ncbi:MAG: hypothetical protein II857_08375 [Selenomonadaceae bacterium]|nr:hypothetical protein [Selenomonadaceae bacterium]